jgi:peroxiredoxin
MTAAETRPPVGPGEPAPDFTLPAVDGKAPVSLADYRGKSSVFLSLLIGLWCPFCRRAIAQMGANEAKLKPLGVETLAIVATPPENAQLYFKFRPTPLRLGADPHLTTHRAYGLPKPPLNEEFMNAMQTTKINPYGDFPQPLPVMEAAMATAKRDGYAGTEIDRADQERQFPQLKGWFLIDRGGIVRWAKIECATEGMAGVGKFPAAEEIAAVAREVAGR